jgi:hypothetical protein
VTPDQLTVDRLIGRIAACDQALDQACTTREQARAALGSDTAGIIAAAETALRRLEQATGPVASLDEVLADLDARFTRRKERLAAAGAQARRAVRERCERDLAALRDRVAAASADLQAGIAADAGRRQAYEAFARKVGTLRDRLTACDRQVTTTASQARCRPEGLDAAEPVVAGDPRQAVTGLIALVSELEAAHATLRRSSVFTDCRWRGRLFNHACMLVPHALAWGVLPLVGITQAELWIALSAAATQGLPPVFTVMQRRRLAPILAQQRAALAAIGRKLDRVARQGRERLDPLGTVDDRLHKALAGDASQARSEATAKEAAQAAITALKVREEALGRRMAAAHQRAVAAARDRLAAEGAAALAQVGRDQARIAAERGAAVQAAEQARQAALVAAEAACAAVAAEQAAFRDEAQGLLAASHPAWDASAAQAATQHPVLLPLGTVAAPFGELPVAVVFPGHAAVLARTQASGRPAALALVHQLLFRALAGFPPGAVRLTMIDPVGLGESFAPLLELAHGREGAIAAPVLSAPEVIDQGLADLEAHCAMIIQKRLGARFATLAEYNREAGGLREPVRLVVVADLPAGLTERAAERLAALLRSGPRCGVHVWMLADAARSLPPVLDPALVRAHGVVLRERDGHLQLDHEGARDLRFTPAPGPDPAQAAALVARTADQAVAAARVALPFALLAPPAEQLWTRRSAAGLAIPLGNCGAGRNQALELGRGTAQHVLIGGRTGSGKSTLLHILTTSAALWYAPSELQLCLIDFKKGVEFRAYAAVKLPHALSLIHI